MPIVTTWETSGFVGVHSGNITGEELRHSITEIMFETAYRAARYAIVDLRLVDKVSAKADDFEYVDMARIGSYQSNPGLKIAIVAPAHLSAWADQRSREMNSAPPEIRHDTQVFASMESARAWAME
jgi:hypothetical protein